MKRLSYIDLDYCRFSDYGYKKPTRVWGYPEIRNLPNILCNPKSCDSCFIGPSGKVRHRQWLGGYGPQPHKQQKWRIPKAFIQYLMTGKGQNISPVSETSPKNDHGF